ncbi:hypothetical protein DY000_02006331 [Brassica cretica]|uniref:Uncharacterized protein n=1 Tax=Brassica cretica TaxID=69181 RepID=A0ABQ7BTV9_BRACR|nr:hypothetical protein DY000_02006331 [Brassica cretica]
MEGVPDLSALLKDKLQLLSKKSTSAGALESSRSEDVGASKERASSLVDEGVDAEPSASSPKKKMKSKKSKRKVTDETLDANAPLGEAVSLDDASMGSKTKKKKEGKKRPREGTTSSDDQDEAPAEGQEDAAEGLVEADSVEAVSEDRPKKKAKKKSAETEPRPSVDGFTPVDVAGRGSLSPETPLEKRRKVSASDSRSESAASERSAPDSITRRGARSEGSLAKRGGIEFPNRVQFAYDGKTPLIFNPLQCAELTRQICGGTRELPPIGDLYFKDEYIDAAFTRKRSDTSMNFLVEKYDSTLKQTMVQLGASEKLAQARLKAIKRVRAEHKKANDKAAEEKEILRAKFEELEEGEGVSCRLIPCPRTITVSIVCWTAKLAGEHNHATVQLASELTGAVAKLAGRVQPHGGSARRRADWRDG